MNGEILPEISYKIKNLYENIVLKYAERNKIVAINISSGIINAKINIKINVFTLLTGFTLEYELKPEYKRGITRNSDGRLVIESIKTKDSRKLTKHFKPLFNHYKTYTLENYDVNFEMIDNLKSSSPLVAHIPLSPEVSSIIDLESFEMSKKNYKLDTKDEYRYNTKILIVFNGNSLVY